MKLPRKLGSRDTSRPSIARRRMLSGVGASGLAAAMVLFGRTPAHAVVTYQCCHLCRWPNISFSTCIGAAEFYSWYCRVGEGGCHCCERGRKGDGHGPNNCSKGNTGSAVYCRGR